MPVSEMWHLVIHICVHFVLTEYLIFTVHHVPSCLHCKNRRPYNLYCVGADVKPCSINQPSLEYWL